MYLCWVSLKKEWRLYDLEKQELIVSHDVVFLEDVFPFADNSVLDNGRLPHGEIIDKDFEDSPTPIVRGLMRGLLWTRLFNSST